MSLQDAIQAKREYEGQFEQSRLITKAELIEVDGSVEVPDRPGWCWVREYGQTGGVYQVFNPSAQRRAGLPVLIGPEPKAPWRRRVLGVDWEMLPNMDDYRGSPYLPSHAPDHEWPDFKPGADAVSVYPRAIVPPGRRPVGGAGVGHYRRAADIERGRGGFRGRWWRGQPHRLQVQPAVLRRVGG